MSGVEQPSRDELLALFAAQALPYSSGLVEGTVRRANFDLLRKRVLLAT